jgi:hypothetical protein
VSVDPWPGFVLPTWTTPDAIATAARRALDMADDDVDAPVVLSAATSAILLVDGYVGTPGEPWPAVAPQPVIDATVIVTVELYRRKDATFGVLNSWTGSDFGPVRVSTDWLKGVESIVHPYMRDHFGVG